MTFQILHASNGVESVLWDALINKLPAERRDIHFTSAYGRVQERLGGKAVLAALTVPPSFLIMQPFIIRAVPDSGSFDLCSPYGYGGPVATSESATALACASFSHELMLWAARNNIVAEFCRFHPMIAGHQFELSTSLAPRISSEKMVTVIGLDNLSEATVSRRVRRALYKTKATIVVDLKASKAEREQFALLYLDSMMRKRASERWLFPREYLDAHFDELSARLFYASDFMGTRLLMVIGGYGKAYAHLLASNGESMHSGRDERLYYDAALKLREDGYRLFHLGGGTTADPNDSLLAFKRGFGGLDLQTFVYRRVFDEPKYRELTAAKIREEWSAHGRGSMSDYFPEYRREFA